jgi:lipoprotein NlpI
MIEDVSMRWRKVGKSFLIFFLVFGFLTCTSKEKQAQKHYMKGFDYHNQGLAEKAIEEYQQALKLNPNYIEAYMNIGAIYVDKKDYDQAIQQFKKAVELNYYYGKAHYNLGMVYLYKGEKEKAQEELKILKGMGSGLADNLESKMLER